MTEEDEELTGLDNVPAWVLRLVRDISETKVSLKALEGGMKEIALRMDTFVSLREYQSHVQHEEERVNQLWDARQQELGRVEQLARQTALWRWGTATAIGLLTLWGVLRSVGVQL